MARPVSNPLTFGEHRELGEELLKMRSRFLHLSSVVAAVYGSASLPAFSFDKVNEAIERLCVEMQGQADADCPRLDAGVFYGGPKMSA